MLDRRIAVDSLLGIYATMWQKRTEDEIADAKRQAIRIRKRISILAGIGFAVLFMFVRGRGWSLHHASPYISWDEMPARIPFALVLGFLAGWVIYRFRSSSKRTMICPHCDKTKFDDGAMRCSCGRDFVDIETVKWV
jgi:hypothetical protein